jgi:threonylcarbamoyladenosine tRNA methylthiotransferase MtaB
MPPRSAKTPAVKGKDPLPLRTARAYLKVQDGCSGSCTFCIVPKFRGKSESVPFDELLERARRFIDAGYREIVVTGCNLSLYASQGKRLAELIAALAATDRGVRIRLGSLEPGERALETVHAIAENANICRFLHIPVQSGSDRILKAMQRPYSVEAVEELVKLADSLIDDVALGCDMMAGFPGETQADFLESAKLLKRCRFTNAHVFPYSERPGTPAAAFPSPIPKDIRSARAKQLAEIAERERKRFKRGFVGKRVEVLIEDERKSAGWTSQYLWFERSRPQSRNAPKRREIAVFTVGEIKNGVLRGI